MLRARLKVNRSAYLPLSVVLPGGTNASQFLKAGIFCMLGCPADVSIGGVPAGRIKMELFADICPKTVENFRQMCTGEFRCSGAWLLTPCGPRNSHVGWNVGMLHLPAVGAGLPQQMRGCMQSKGFAVPERPCARPPAPPGCAGGTCSQLGTRTALSIASSRAS